MDRTPQQDPQTAFIQSIVRTHGRDASGFEARILDNGTVAVSGPGGTALYPLDGWTSKFVRHLDQGFYGAAMAPAANDE